MNYIGGYGNVNWTNEQHNVQNKKPRNMN